jgi:hypothetical protein
VTVGDECRYLRMTLFTFRQTISFLSVASVLILTQLFTAGGYSAYREKSCRARKSILTTIPVAGTQKGIR